MFIITTVLLLYKLLDIAVTLQATLSLSRIEESNDTVFSFNNH